MKKVFSIWSLVLGGSLLVACASKPTAVAGQPSEALRKPASACRILTPYYEGSKGKIALAFLLKDPEFNDLLTSKGYEVVKPDDSVRTPLQLLKMMKTGETALLTNGHWGLINAGVGSILVIRKTESAWEIPYVIEPPGGDVSSIAEGLKSLPDCR